MGISKQIIIGTLALSSASASIGAEALRCLKDGKIIITDVSCAALGGAIDTNPQPPQPARSKGQVETMPPTVGKAIRGPTETPKTVQAYPLQNPTQQVQNVGRIGTNSPSSYGFLQWGLLIVVIALLVRFFQKVTKSKSQHPKRPTLRFRPIEPHLAKENSSPESLRSVTTELDQLQLNVPRKTDTPIPYKQAPLMSRYEIELFQRLRNALPECEIFPQVPLAAFIRIDRQKAGQDFFQNSYTWQNRIGQQRLDYLVCLRDDLTIVAGIELDDPSHDNSEAKGRDQKKEKSLRDACVPLVRWRVEAMPTAEQIRAQFVGICLQPVDAPGASRLATIPEQVAAQAAEANEKYRSAAFDHV